MTIKLDWNKWSEWMKLDGLDLSSIPNKPGTYIIATRKSLNRVVGTDLEGFLDVGESEYLNDRIATFIRCAQNPNVYGHMAGVRFSFLGFSDFFPFSELWIRFVRANTKKKAYSTEGEILKQYVNAHKELPPLNYKYNWSKH